MCAATLVEAASPLALSLAWTLVGVAFGTSSDTLSFKIKRQTDGTIKSIKARPCIRDGGVTIIAPQQLLIWMLLFCRVVTGTFDFDGDIEGCATIMLFVHLLLELGRFARLTLETMFDYILPESKAPPWLGPAPYVPNGGSYGYAMLQYRVKKKSGHARPKHCGEQEPLTSRSLTFWFGQTSFHSALLATIIFCVVSVVSRKM